MIILHFQYRFCLEKRFPKKQVLYYQYLLNWHLFHSKSFFLLLHRKATFKKGSKIYPYHCKCSDPREGTSFFKCYPLQTIFWVFVLLCGICYHHWPNDWHICSESRKVHQVIVTWKWLQRSVCIKSIQRQINKIMWYLIQHRQKTLFKHLHFYNQHLTAVTL